MVEIFAEVKRVLRADGTLWLNLGDSYAQGGKRATKEELEQDARRAKEKNYSTQAYAGYKGWDRSAGTAVSGLKPKDLCGIPWRVAFALQQDGWYLRQDIIWAKPNPMPESVTDRCTKAHEYIFLLSKNKKYYYDADAIREKQDPSSLKRLERGWNGDGNRGYPNGPQNHIKNYMGKTKEEIDSLPGRNKRSVWTVTTKPYSEAHFATFPPDLIEPCILAGCPEDGIVLDPFMGSGTTAMVAYENRRNYVGCELNPEYIKMDRAEKAKEKYGLFEKGKDGE